MRGTDDTFHAILQMGRCTFSVLEWLQYLTQVTLEKNMGSIAGYYGSRPWEQTFLYRFFIWISRAAHPVIF